MEYKVALETNEDVGPYVTTAIDQTEKVRARVG
jgi:hypothetical protein